MSRRRRTSNRDVQRAALALIEKAIAPGGAAMFAQANRGAQPRALSMTDAVRAMTGQGPLSNGNFTSVPLPRSPMDEVPFGPLWPLAPMPLDPARRDTGRPEPRISEYPVAWNIPGAGERLIPWRILREAADSVDIIRRCIEVRKKHIRGLDSAWAISEKAIADVHQSDSALGREDAERKLREQFLPEIRRMEEFWANPWKSNGWSFGQWVNGVIEEHLVLDAVAIYPRATYGGDVCDLEVLDGTTIKPLLDYRGARPQYPSPAYQQILYGFPRGEWQATATEVKDADGKVIAHQIESGFLADQLFYGVENVRSFTPYGYSAVEQALISAKMYLARQGWMISEYDDGVGPVLWLVPQGKGQGYGPQNNSIDGMNPQQRQQWQDSLNDMLSGNTKRRQRAQLAPPGMMPYFPPGIPEQYKPEYDLHLIKLLAGHFSVTMSELGFTEAKGLGNSGLHEGQADVEQRVGQRPDERMVAELVNELSRDFLKCPPEVCFRFVNDDAEDTQAQDAVAKSRRERGVITVNDDRRDAGKPPLDLPEADMPMVLQGGAWVPLEGLAAAARQKIEAEQALVEDQLATSEQGRELAEQQAEMDAAATEEDTLKAVEGRALTRWRAKGRNRGGRAFICKHLEPGDWPDGVPGDVDFADWAWVPDGEPDGMINKDYSPWWPRDSRGRWVKRGGAGWDAGPGTPGKEVLAGLRAQGERDRAARAAALPPRRASRELPTYPKEVGSVVEETARLRETEAYLADRLGKDWRDANMSEAQMIAHRRAEARVRRAKDAEREADRALPIDNASTTLDDMTKPNTPKPMTQQRAATVDGERVSVSLRRGTANTAEVKRNGIVERTAYVEDGAAMDALLAAEVASVRDSAPSRAERADKLREGMASLAGGGEDSPMVARIKSAQEEDAREVINSLADVPGAWVPLADVRRKLAERGFTPEAQDNTIRRMAARFDGVNLVPEENQKTLTDADHAAAIDLGAGPQHLIQIEAPRKSVLDTVRETTERAQAARAVVDSIPGLREGTARQQSRVTRVGDPETPDGPVVVRPEGRGGGYDIPRESPEQREAAAKTRIDAAEQAHMDETRKLNDLIEDESLSESDYIAAVDRQRSAVSAAAERFYAAEREWRREFERPRQAAEREQQRAALAEHERQQAARRAADEQAKRDAAAAAEQAKRDAEAAETARLARKREALIEQTPTVYARALDGDAPQVTHGPSRQILTAMREQGFVAVDASVGGSTGLFEAPDGRRIRMSLGRDGKASWSTGEINRADVGRIMSQKDALALVKGTPERRAAQSAGAAPPAETPAPDPTPVPAAEVGQVLPEVGQRRVWDMHEKNREYYFPRDPLATDPDDIRPGQVFRTSSGGWAKVMRGQGTTARTRGSIQILESGAAYSREYSLDLAREAIRRDKADRARFGGGAPEGPRDRAERLAREREAADPAAEAARLDAVAERWEGVLRTSGDGTRDAMARNNAEYARSEAARIRAAQSAVAVPPAETPAPDPTPVPAAEAGRADHPQKAVFDKLLDEGRVKHRQARQIVEQMEAHGWRLTDESPMVQTTSWEAPDGRKMTVQFLTSDKPKFYPGGSVLGGNPSYKAALAHVVTPTHEEVGGPNIYTAANRVSPGLGDRVSGRVTNGGQVDQATEALGRAARQLSGYGSTQKRTPDEVTADLRSQADRLDALAQSNAEHYERMGVADLGGSRVAERQREQAQQLRQVADILAEQATERAAYEAERDRRAAAPLDIRPTSRGGAARPQPAPAPTPDPTPVPAAETGQGLSRKQRDMAARFDRLAGEHATDPDVAIWRERALTLTGEMEQVGRGALARREADAIRSHMEQVQHAFTHAMAGARAAAEVRNAGGDDRAQRIARSKAELDSRARKAADQITAAKTELGAIPKVRAGTPDPYAVERQRARAKVKLLTDERQRYLDRIERVERDVDTKLVYDADGKLSHLSYEPPPAQSVNDAMNAQMLASIASASAPAHGSVAVADIKPGMRLNVGGHNVEVLSAPKPSRAKDGGWTVRVKREDQGIEGTHRIGNNQATVPLAAPKGGASPKGDAASVTAPATGDGALAAAPLSVEDEGARKVDAAARRALEHYRGKAFTEMNREVRAGAPSTATARTMEQIDRIMDESRLTRDVEVYRSIGDVGAVFGDAAGRRLVGVEWTDAAPQSTSTVQDKADTFLIGEGGRRTAARIVMRVPAGVGAVQLSDGRYEAELLLQRGLRMRVVADTGPWRRGQKNPRTITVEVVPA